LLKSENFDLNISQIWASSAIVNVEDISFFRPNVPISQVEPCDNRT